MNPGTLFEALGFAARKQSATKDREPRRNRRVVPHFNAAILAHSLNEPNGLSGSWETLGKVSGSTRPLAARQGATGPMGGT